MAVGGVNAPVSFAGLAPGFAGLYQINFTIPPGVTSGAATLLVRMLDKSSQANVTVAVSSPWQLVTRTVIGPAEGL